MAEWIKNKKRNEKIRKLREDGYSIKGIATKLGCCKSTVSYQCRGIEPKTRDRIEKAIKANRKNLRDTSTKRWDKLINEVKHEAKKEWKELRHDPNMVGFLGLYWGEGRKTNSSIGISNNNPDIIKICHSFFRTLEPNKQFRISIIYYPSHKKSEVEKFWKELLDDDNIKWAIKKNTDKRGNSHYNERCPYGRCQLQFNNYKIFHRILTWIECWKEETMGRRPKRSRHWLVTPE